MKNALFIFFGLVVGAFGTWLALSHEARSAATTPASIPIPQGVSDAHPRPPSPPPPVSLHQPTREDWQAFRSAREQAFGANADLKTEYQSLLAAMDQQQKDLDAAMVKADPSVAPMVAKLQALRQRNSVPGGPSTTTSSNPTSPPTPEDWQKLRVARQSALQATPDLARRIDQLKISMMALQQKLVPAMIKADPQIASTLDKLQPDRPKSAVPAAPK